MSQKHTTICDLEESSLQLKTLQTQVDELKHKFDALTQLSKITDNLREELRKNTIKMIESETNRYLETYFDAELRVVFSADGADKLDVLIWKSGHECSYKQLSKGQRGLLKLAFSVSCMKAVSNKLGLSFNALFFDESLDGLDTELKLKAFNLFDELSKSHDTVLIIDHSEQIKNLFSRIYCVNINSDISTIQEI